MYGLNADSNMMFKDKSIEIYGIYNIKEKMWDIKMRIFECTIRELFEEIKILKNVDRLCEELEVNRLEHICIQCEYPNKEVKIIGDIYDKERKIKEEKDNEEEDNEEDNEEEDSEEEDSEEEKKDGDIYFEFESGKEIVEIEVCREVEIKRNRSENMKWKVGLNTIKYNNI